MAYTESKGVPRYYLHCACLSQFAGLTLPLHQGKDIPFTHGTLDVSNDSAVGVVEELHSDLGHVSGVSSATEHLVHFGKLRVTSRSVPYIIN